MNQENEFDHSTLITRKANSRKPHCCVSSPGTVKVI